MSERSERRGGFPAHQNEPRSPEANLFRPLRGHILLNQEKKRSFCTNNTCHSGRAAGAIRTPGAPAHRWPLGSGFSFREPRNDGAWISAVPNADTTPPLMFMLASVKWSQ